MRWIASLFLALSLISTSFADSLSKWDIVPSESSITFTATQNNAPVTGSFNTFTGTVYGDPASLKGSITLVVSVESLSVTYAELATILITPEWFNTKAFPKATFKAEKFTKIDDKHYQATGELTIKNKSVPMTIEFTATEVSKDHVLVEGKTQLKRSTFGIGTGAWANTDVIKDEVTLTFKLGVKR